MDSATALRAVKLAHTVAWALLAGSILAIPLLAWRAAFTWAWALTAVVMVEVVVLALNGMRCPLTDVASRYTHDRHDNFDIYLPLWLATWNKHIFGTLFVAGLMMTLTLWLLRDA
jgi:hypothetical protein